LAHVGHRNSSSRGPQAAGRAENFAQEFTGNWASKCGRMSGPTRAARSLTIWCLLGGGDSRRRLRCHALAFPLAGVAVQLPPQPGLRARGGRYALTPNPSPRGRGELSDSLSAEHRGQTFNINFRYCCHSLFVWGRFFAGTPVVSRDWPTSAIVTLRPGGRKLPEGRKTSPKNLLEIGPASVVGCQARRGRLVL
jgi:hypothetical protein